VGEPAVQPSQPWLGTCIAGFEEKNLFDRNQVPTLGPSSRGITPLDREQGSLNPKTTAVDASASIKMKNAREDKVLKISNIRPLNRFRKTAAKV